MSWTNADEWLLVEAAGGVIPPAARNQAEPRNTPKVESESSEGRKEGRKEGSLALLGSPAVPLSFTYT